MVLASKTKYMEVGGHRSMTVKEHITVSSNSYDKVKASKYLGSLLRNKIYIHGEIRFIKARISFIQSTSPPEGTLSHGS